LTSTSRDDFDFIIVGSGIAGLRAAVTLASVGRVLILTKADPTESNTGYAQGGIAAALGPDDSPDLHFADTIRAGDGLCDEATVRVLVEEGPRYVRELIELGASFDRDAQGRLALGLEAAHSVRRILHTGDATGRSIGRALWETVRPLGRVTTVKHALVIDLIVREGRVAGVRYFDRAGARRTADARAVLLATGGAGQVYSETTNPAVATGDGIALAYHAGARVADLEFVQFHPTALKLRDAPRFLISEALRGEGARLVNAHGETFMSRYHLSGDLAPRDVVARAIVREADASGGPIFLTLAHLDPDRVRNRFPTIAAMCRQAGIDIATDRIPVGPAAHYLMGGVETDAWGRTSKPGLFAAGETACTGVHGANRLASNSLLEGLVFGARAAEAMQATASEWPSATRGAWTVVHDTPPDLPAIDPSTVAPDVVRSMMWRSAGLFRTRDGLTRSLAWLESVYGGLRRGLTHETGDEARWRQFNLVSVARLVVRAALRREESRGGHFREDFPERDDLHWKVHVSDIDSTAGR
jgi:L-aspartate oxidase